MFALCLYQTPVVSFDLISGFKWIHGMHDDYIYNQPVFNKLPRVLTVFHSQTLVSDFLSVILCILALDSFCKQEWTTCCICRLMQSWCAEWVMLPWAWSRPVPWWPQRRSQTGCLLVPSSQTPWLSLLAEKHTNSCYKSNLCKRSRSIYSTQTSRWTCTAVSVHWHSGKVVWTQRDLGPKIFHYVVFPLDGSEAPRCTVSDGLRSVASFVCRLNLVSKLHTLLINRKSFTILNEATSRENSTFLDFVKMFYIITHWKILL